MRIGCLDVYHECYKFIIKIYYNNIYLQELEEKRIALQRKINRLEVELENGPKGL